MKVKKYNFPFKAMGSPCEFQIYAYSDIHAFSAIRAAYQEVKRLEKKYSRYREDSVATFINNNAYDRPIEVDHETSVLLDYAQTAYEQSNGNFDITSGVLRRAWNFKSQSIPTPSQINEALTMVGWDKVVWKNHEIQFSVSGMEIDFGGYVKEYAVDAAAKVFNDCECCSGLVDLGGDVRILGCHPDGSGWKVGVRNPRRPREVLASIVIDEGSIASSGDYERCIWINGQRYAHILNPKTGWPVEGLASVSIHAESCLIAGSCTTFAMLQEESQALNWLCQLELPYVAVDQQQKVYLNNKPVSSTKKLLNASDQYISSEFVPRDNGIRRSYSADFNG